MEIKGFPLYTIDLVNDVLINWLGRGRSIKGRKNVLMKCGDTYIQVSCNRLRYAVQNGISYHDIPKDIRIIERDGRLVATFIDTMVERSLESRQRKDKKMSYIEMKMNEIQIMKRRYETGDTREAELYIESLKDEMCYRYMRCTGASKKTAEDIFADAATILVERIKREQNTVTCISYTLRGLMSKVRANRRRNKMFFENKKIKEEELWK